MKKIGEHLLRSNMLSKNHSCSPENTNYCFCFFCQVDLAEDDWKDGNEIFISTVGTMHTICWGSSGSSFCWNSWKYDSFGLNYYSVNQPPHQRINNYKSTGWGSHEEEKQVYRLSGCNPDRLWVTRCSEESSVKLWLCSRFQYHSKSIASH